MGQLSFYSADARPRALTDLEGLLCGPGSAELFGQGRAGRLTVALGPLPPPDDETPDESPADESPADEPPEADRPGTAGPGTTGPGTAGPDSAGPDSARIDDERHDRDDVAGPDGAGAEDDWPAEEPTPPDLDELAFLDLDPDELAARLAPRATRPEPVSAPPPEPDRECGVPDVERQRRRIADMPDETTRWRAHAVRCALRARGVPAEIGWAEDGRVAVRTPFRADLAELAAAWLKGPEKRVPEGFELDGPRLRLWVLAAGACDGRAYTLGLEAADAHLFDTLLTACRRAGLGARLVGGGLRIVGSRRRARLGELVGRPPRDLRDGVWPV